MVTVLEKDFSVKLLSFWSSPFTIRHQKAINKHFVYKEQENSVHLFCQLVITSFLITLKIDSCFYNQLSKKFLEGQ
jgi:hypothetical protein